MGPDRTGRSPREAGRGELHVWSLRFADAGWLDERLVRRLDDAERERARRFATEELQRRWSIGRGALREILAGYLGISARDVPIVLRPCTVCGGPHGKPALAPPADGVRFNVSHTTERLLVAVADDREVGIDAEPIARASRLAATARSWLAEPEAARLERLPSPEREEALLRLWTFKEAYLKAVGIGLNADLREVVVGLDAQPVLQAAPGEADPQRWLMLPVETSADTVAALVVPGREGEPRPPHIELRTFEP
jgi:4'-phosphopantetheinyl transferase